MAVHPPLHSKDKGEPGFVTAARRLCRHECRRCPVLVAKPRQISGVADDREDVPGRQEILWTAADSDARPIDRRAVSRVDAARVAVRSHVRCRGGGDRDAARACHRIGTSGVGAGAIPSGLLRHLVGVDEFHLVRLVVRHRRRPLSTAHPHTDGGSVVAGRGNSRGLQSRRLRRHHPGLPGDARRAGGAMASSRSRGRGGPGNGAAVCAGHHRCGGAVAGSAAGGRIRCTARRRPAVGVRHTGRRRARGSGVGGAGERHSVAPAPHCRALLAFHDHPAG